MFISVVLQKQGHIIDENRQHKLGTSVEQAPKVYMHDKLKMKLDMYILDFETSLLTVPLNLFHIWFSWTTSNSLWVVAYHAGPVLFSLLLDL